MQVQEANQDYNEEIIAEREAILQFRSIALLHRLTTVRYYCETTKTDTKVFDLSLFSSD